MINTGKSFNIHDYIEVIFRRIWYIVIPFSLVMFGAAIYSFTASPKYRASTLILVTPQKVPVDYVRPTITSTIEDRLQSIGQEIMSRTRLEQIIAEFKLYQNEAKTLTLEEIVELMRKDVTVQIRGREGYFTISYTGKDPRIVTMVTNKLASLFIEENLRLREQQAQGTTEFLTIEMDATKAKLDEIETLITQFKRQFMYELPDQRNTNLSIVGRLQLQLQTISDTLKSAQDRKLVVQKQLTEMKNMAALLIRQEESKEERSPVSNTAGQLSSSRSGSSPPRSRMKNPYEAQVEQLRNHLTEIQAKYTEKHPDIAATKKRIADLERKIEKDEASLREADREKIETAEEKEMSPSRGVAGAGGTSKEKRKEEEKPDAGIDPFYKEMEGQLAVTDLEIQRLRDEEAKTKAQIALYQTRIENTPIREMAMVNLSRDYENTKETYQTLLKKNQGAQQAENLERRQKGEQFKVVDPARIPEKPYSPNIPRILLFGILLGLGSGFGMAFFKEQMDRSFRDAEDLEATLGLRVVANIPKLDKKAA
jgi:polysaccharide chain length determinant protein (PEP-CTERM system associated)